METGMYEQYQDLLIERKGAILHVTLNNPPLNPMTLRMHTELGTIFTDINRDEQARVVVLSGSGRAFSAGGNIKDMREKLDDIQFHLEFMASGAKIIYGLIDCEKPVICKMNGHAMGLGASIALLCDIIIASDRAKIADPHVLMGLSAGDGGSLIWPQLIGFARAKEYLMLGDVVMAPKAAEMGLINYAVPLEALDAKVDEIAQRLAKGAYGAISRTKRSVNFQLRQHATALVEAHFKLELETILGPEHREAVMAYFEEREPDFLKAVNYSSADKTK